MNAEGAYIEEIILVDDSSTMENLGEKLEIALSYFKKPMVKLIRNFERMGLIQRWEGAKNCPDGRHLMALSGLEFF